MITEPTTFKLHEFKKNDGSGIVIIENLVNYKFICKRLYIIQSESKSDHGHHGHKKLGQIFICIQGSVTIKIVGNKYNKTFKLSNKKEGLFLPSGYWRELTAEKNTNLIVMASEPFLETDYIRDFEDYKKWVKNIAYVI
jgi:dTDP-4-dehydrorhamnose 3,5-epimerase-like enzyme